MPDPLDAYWFAVIALFLGFTALGIAIALVFVVYGHDTQLRRLKRG